MQQMKDVVHLQVNEFTGASQCCISKQTDLVFGLLLLTTYYLENITSFNYDW